MKREIQYDTTDRSKAETKALKDVKQWFGTKKYNQFVKAFTV